MERPFAFKTFTNKNKLKFTKYYFIIKPLPNQYYLNSLYHITKFNYVFYDKIYNISICKIRIIILLMYFGSFKNMLKI